MANEKAAALNRLKLIEDAIAEGVLKVKYSDKEVTYRSSKEMYQIRDDLKKKACVSTSSCAKKGLFGGKRINMQHSKGLDDC